MQSSIWRVFALFVVFGALLLLAEEVLFQRRVDAEAAGLESIAAVVAAEIDGDAHETVRGPRDVASPAFESIRHKLREMQEHYKLRSAIYTLRPVQDEEGRPATEFVVMTNSVPFVGNRYQRLPAMNPVFDHGERSRTGLYRSDSGWWVSGYAPVKAKDGRVVSLVEVDRASEDLAAELDSRRMLVLLLAAAAALTGTALSAWMSRGRGRIGVMSRVTSASLALRIGVAGALAVLVAVGIVGLLDHREARRELVGQLTGHLLSTVRIGASLIEPGLHQEVIRSSDAKSNAFVELRDRLRLVQTGAGLSSPMYTLCRDGDLVRFVVMTNEVPFIGDPYELRPALRRSFEDSQPGSEGPYTDAHGTWLSAWAPIPDADGRPAAFLQADYEVGALLTTLTNRSLRRIVFAMIGMSVAFGLAGLMARSIARPVLELARSAELIAGGDLKAEVDIERTDEIGTLARSFNKMVHNLEAMSAALQGYAATAEASKELELAARIRSNLALAGPLQVPGASVSGRLEPAELGAATYDAFLLGQGAYLVFFIARADAAGVDGLSTLLSAKSRLGSLIGNFTFRPGAVAAELNRTLADSKLAMDLQFGVLDIAEGWVTLCNAGGAYPYVLRADGTLAQLDTPSGPRLGQDLEASYLDTEVKIEPGDRLVLYSGYPLQHRNESGQEYGLERLEQCFQRHARKATTELPSLLLENLLEHSSSDEPREDDIAFVVVEYRPSGGAVHAG